MTGTHKVQKLSADDLLGKLKREHDFSISAPIDIDVIAELLDIRVEYKPTLDDNVGSISFQGESAVVTINPIENSFEPRRRFTLAHEIAHYCLHKDEERNEFVDTRKTMSRKGSYWDVYESEANSFAAGLLMPKNELIRIGREMLKAYLEKNSVKKMPAKIFILEMANKFEVSNPAMEYRLKNLGIVKSKSQSQ